MTNEINGTENLVPSTPIFLMSFDFWQKWQCNLEIKKKVFSTNYVGITQHVYEGKWNSAPSFHHMKKLIQDGSLTQT